LCCGCGSTSPDKGEFLSFGAFAVKALPDGSKEVTDGIGRKLVLVPRGQEPPSGYEKSEIIPVPVRRVAAYSAFDAAMLKALGVVQDVLVGVTKAKEEWTIPEVISGMENGKIAYLGEPESINLEALTNARPEIVMTWDQSAIPMLDELNIPCIITTTPVAADLDARMRFVQFLAPFFDRQKEADAFVERVTRVVDRIRQKAQDLPERPKVMWGDVYEKRVMVEPGNCWVAEFVRLAGANYLFDDVFGSACIEISLERFITSGKDADTLFTYRTANVGVTSKEAMARTNPAVERIGPIQDGKVLSPLPHYAQSADRLDEILEEVASILHPGLFPKESRNFFAELPDRDNLRKEGE
jgi:iron complex transport system substrate-binding protein